MESQREKRKTEKAKKAKKFKLDSRRSSPARSYSNEFPAFPSMSGCYLCVKPGHFWRNYYRSRNSPASGSNAGYSWQRQLLPVGTVTIAANGPPIRDPSNSGSDVTNLPQYDDSGETDFIDLFDYNKADVIGLITVFDAILTSRQPREKLQCL